MRTDNLRSPLAVVLLAAAAVVAVVTSPTAWACIGYVQNGQCVAWEGPYTATPPSTQGKDALQALRGSTAPAKGPAKPAALRTTRGAATGPRTVGNNMPLGAIPVKTGSVGTAIVPQG